MPVITIAMHSTTEEVKKNLIESLTAAAVAATSVPQEKFVVFVENMQPMPSVWEAGRSRRSRLRSNSRGPIAQESPEEAT